MLLIAGHVGYLLHVTLRNIDCSLLSNSLFAGALHLISFVSVVSDISNMLTTSTLYVHLGLNHCSNSPRHAADKILANLL